MLFGVRLVVDSMRKSVSMNNLSQYEYPDDNHNIKDTNNKNVLDTGYADAVLMNSGKHRCTSASEGFNGRRKSTSCSRLDCIKKGKVIGEDSTHVMFDEMP